MKSEVNEYKAFVVNCQKCDYEYEVIDTIDGTMDVSKISYCVICGELL
jgi:hypothetical protein